MAKALDPSNEILDIFSHLNRMEMTLIELHTYLAHRIPRITMDEVLRLIRQPNLIDLFNLQRISNDLCLIQLSPKLTLCEGCLQRGCKNKGNCTKLHLCRITSHFTDKSLEKPCTYPHRLTDHPNNLILLQRHNYDSLNKDLLLNLLRLHYSQTQTDRARFNKSRPTSQTKKSPIPSTENLADRQLDVSIPSSREAPDVDLEIIQLLLATKDIIVERIFDKQISNEFYRRFTIQFASKSILDHLLATEPIIVYHKIPIKLKRTQRQRDTKIFALKFSTNQKIDQIRLNLYVETLVGKIQSNIFDMTPDGNNEQIYLIRCEQSIDFDHLYKVHSAKNTLQGHRVIIAEVYETETLAISFNQRLALTIPKLRQLFGEKRWLEDVFACLSIHNQTSVEIELMNAEITAKWLSEAHRFEREFSLTMNPVIDFIQSEEKKNEEEDEEIQTLLTKSNLSPSNLSDDVQKRDNETNVYFVKHNWKILLTHPIFGDEYRKYIREHLNISVQITGSSIQVPNDYIRKELARYTNMFVQHFVFREVSDLDKTQVRLIKENYSRMAHKWQKDTNKTLLVARRDVMNELFPSLVSLSRNETKTPMTSVFRPKQSPSIPEESIQTEENVYTLPYSIENSVYLPLFNPPNSFSDRLRTYLLDTFNARLEIKKPSPTKYVLELKGPRKDVSEARPALTSLFASLKTKTYSDTNGCQFSMSDVSRVAQWNLDQCSIVSSCSFSTKDGGTLSVRYFADNPQFGTDEQKLDDVLLHQLVGKSYRVVPTSRILENKLQELENRIQRRSDYGQDICCLFNHEKDSPAIHLYGMKPIVQQISREVKKITEEHTPTPCQVQLQPKEVEYLLKICSNDLMRVEREYENDGVDLRSKLKAESSEFLAPRCLHEKMKLFLLEKSRIQTISNDYRCSAELIRSKKQELDNAAVRNQCLIKITMSSPPSAIATFRTSVPADSKISSGSIRVSPGDLTTEPADVLVVCSTSGLLRTGMIKSAGSQVEQELTGKDPMKNMVDTSAGQLKQAKRLLFIPWIPPSTNSTNPDSNALRQSISIFVQQAIKYTIQGKFQSIAFPAIGCGGFGIDPDVIATNMIDAVREQLTLNPTVQLTVTFVVQQANVFESFKAKLKPSSSTAASHTRSPSPPRSHHREKVTITLTTANSNIDRARKLLKDYEAMLNS